MGAGAEPRPPLLRPPLPWPPLLLPLLLVGLLGQVPGAQAQACSVDKTFLEIEENQTVTEPLVDIQVPEGHQVSLGASSTPSTFEIRNNQLFLTVIPDYEADPVLQAHLECRRGDTLVTQMRVFVSVLDINDNAPIFPFNIKVVNVSEDTRVNSIVISETELEAKDADKDDILFYTLQELTPGANAFFSLVGTNLPALRLDKQLDFDRCQSMSLLLLVRDTEEENAQPSHTASATLTLEVLPADLRPPWFLPCTYSDAYTCIQAEYLGVIPTGQTLPDPLTLLPGPIYAVDGDRGIDQPIIYSFVGGNQDGVFSINASSGNLTMVKDVLSPTTFMLLVKGEQADFARYSVTWVTVEARAADGSTLSFSRSLYRGTVPLGSGAHTIVRDADTPSQPLRVQAQDPGLSDIDSTITYRITNHSAFRMEGSIAVTNVALDPGAVVYAEVEARNTQTSTTTTTVIEIQVKDQEPLPTGLPGSPQPSEAGRTTGPSGSATSEGTRPPGSSQGPSSPSPGGGTGPHPPSGLTTALRPPASSIPGGLPGAGTTASTSPATPGSGGPVPPALSASTPGGPPSVGTSASPPPATPGSRGPEPATSEPGTSWSPPTGPSRTPQTSGAPGGGGSGDSDTDGVLSEDRHFSAAEMAVLGGVLGALLLLALLALMVLIYRQFGHRLKCCSSKALEPQTGGFDNAGFRGEDQAKWEPAPRTAPDEAPPPAPREEPPAPPSPAFPAAAPAGDSPTAVRSILTKERRPEGGYKAVWFGEDIGSEADVVVLNAPTLDRAGHSGSEGSGDEDADPGPAGGPYDATDANNTYI